MSLFAIKKISERNVGNRGTQGLPGDIPSVGSQGISHTGIDGDIGTPGPTCACRLDQDVQDTNVTGAMDGYFLTYNQTDSTWNYNTPNQLDITNINFENIPQFPGSSMAFEELGSYRLWRESNESLIRLTVNDYKTTVLVDDPVAYWRLGETTGSSMIDSSPNGNDGTYVNTGEMTRGSPSLVRDKSNSSVIFNDGGSSSYATTPVVLNPSSTSFSIECWLSASILSPGDGQTQSVIQQEDSGGVGRTWLLIGLDGEIRSALGAVSSSSNFTISINTVYHCVFTYDRTSSSEGDWIWYIDGNPTNNGTITTTESSNGSIRLGSNKDGATFEFVQGTLDEVSVYNKVLTPSQVRSHYLTGRKNI